MRFPVFDNGSCWVKVDFHLHTNADKEFRYEGEPDEYINSYVSALENAGIGMGIITNHNKFDLDEFKQIKRKAKKKGIGILPGVELSVHDGNAGVHTLIVFSELWYANKEQTNHIQSFLTSTFAGIANFENENARSNHNIKQTIDLLDKYNLDYFIVFAHVEAHNGLWGGLKPALIKELFEKEEVRRRVLGFQKVMTHDTRQIIKAQLRERYPAEVQGCDAKNFHDMASRAVASYIKLGDCTFEALQFALRDFGSRVRPDKPQIQHSHIRKISFEGAGTLGGTVINLSSELNTLIGIRGSGKSSILEGVRYALGIPFGEKSSETTYKENLVEKLLQSGGKITIDAVCRRGVEYKITRIFDRDPEVIVNGEMQPGISIRETILHNPIYFGQKDLANTGEGFEKDLIQKLAGEKLDPIRKEIEDKGIEVQDLLRKIMRLTNNALELEGWKSKLSDAEFKLSFYKKYNVEDKLEKHTTYERDEKYINQKNIKINEILTEIEQKLTESIASLTLDANHVSCENQDIIDAYHGEYHKIINCIQNLNTSLSEGRNILSHLQKIAGDFTNNKDTLNDEFAEIERKLSEELQQAGADKISTTEFRKLKSDIDEANNNIAELTKSESEKMTLEEQLKSKLISLNELWQKEFNQIVQMLEVINSAETPLKISATFKSDKKCMSNFIKEKFYGSKLREQTFQAIAEKISDIGDMWENRDVIASLTTSAKTFNEYLIANILDMITWQPPNVYSIEFRGKPLIQHSLGQRASALMLFVLNQKNNDIIIIDQPEDDLDNQTIYDDVIKLIRQMKPNTQFIFATHNANIPVLGDAECVYSCVYSDGKINAIGGGIDCKDVQEQIIAVMEGGKEAFERRRNVYSSWLN
ncbi:TrlF family AAA-like ATPase [Mixta sp. Marseille-Q2659]|uniref:TrlF family AAA-like ATPase n=1 Tax=Mixta sp. Marseille-Q2659 TaxID=2736607 RepID=UPI0023B8CF79|nr:histidinol-phosphatase [Mixta sp. Marseille-Q2659]